MKTFCFLLSFFFLITVDISAQIRPGVKAGVTIPVVPNTNYIIVNKQSPENEFIFNASSVENGITFGVFAEMDLRQHFFLRAELMYSRFEATYELKYTRNDLFPDSENMECTEKYIYVDMPVSLGARIDNFEITSGLVARYVISFGNEMEAMSGYEEAQNPIQLGLQAGVGLNLGNLNLGLAYQLDFTNYGEHMNVNGNSLSLHNRPSRLVATIGYRL